MENEFIKTIHVKTTPDRVWDALTNPDKIEKYMFGSRARSKWQAGSPVEFFIKKEAQEVLVVKGEIIKADPPVYLEHTLFPVMSGIDDIQQNYITVIYQIKGHGNESILTIVQKDFSLVADGEQRYRDSIKGWEAVLPKLIEVAER